MKTTNALVTIVTLSSVVSIVSAQTNIESFDAFAPSQSLNTAFGGSPPVSQFVQNVGFITITPVNGGNPIDGAWFTKTAFLDLSGSIAFSLTGRLEPNDDGSLIEIGLKDASGAEAYSYIPASLFNTQTFSTVTVSINTNGFIPTPPYSAMLDLQHITRWSIGADGFGSGRPFRFSFADLSALPTAPSSLKIGFYPNPGTTIIGTIGKTYSIQASDVIGSLTNWLTLTNITLPFSQNSILFIDTSATNAKVRFYRAKFVP